MQRSSSRRLPAVLGALLAASLPAQNGLLDLTFPQAPRPVRPVLGAAPVRGVQGALPVAPQQGLRWQDLVGGGGGFNDGTRGNAAELARLSQELFELQTSAEELALASSWDEHRVVMYNAQYVQRQIHVVRTNPEARLFPTFDASTVPNLPPISTEDLELSSNGRVRQAQVQLQHQIDSARFGMQQAATLRNWNQHVSFFQAASLAERQLQILTARPDAINLPGFGIQEFGIHATGVPLATAPDGGAGVEEVPMPEGLEDLDAGLLPVKTQRIIFKREYHRGFGTLRSPGNISRGRFFPGHLGIWTGLGPKAEVEGYIHMDPTSRQNRLGYVLHKDLEAKDPKAQWFTAEVEDPADPTRLIEGWIFRASSGDPKRRSVTDNLELRGATDEMGAYNSAGLRFARARHETFTRDGQQMTARVYYRTGTQTPIASLEEGLFDGDQPALILRKGRRMDGQDLDADEIEELDEALFYFVFSGWIPPQSDPHPIDADLRTGVGRFVDAWILSTTWRGTTGINHNFRFYD